MFWGTITILISGPTCRINAYILVYTGEMVKDDLVNQLYTQSWKYVAVDHMFLLQ